MPQYKQFKHTEIHFYIQFDDCDTKGASCFIKQ